MGGEHSRLQETVRIHAGSSPRGRGTLGSSPRGRGHAAEYPLRLKHLDHPRVGGEHDHPLPPGVYLVRIIPAWAGNTNDNPGDHPTSGSSPRGRGTLHFPERIIPAWAGNTRLGCLAYTEEWHGSSPRGRGTPLSKLRNEDAPDHPRVGEDRQVGSGGSSPRGRGTHDVGSARGRALPDHPRVGGEHLYRRMVAERCRGSSPRGRGTLHLAQTGRLELRIIPAWAGNTSHRQR